MFKTIRVNMSDLSIKTENIPPEYEGLGGRGLTSAIISREVEPTCSPIGPLNKLIFAPGLLGGTNCANSGRISVGGKSPLTGTIKEANSGGQAGQYLARLGLAAIIVEGQPQDNKLFKLFVGKDKCELTPADDLKGLGNYATVDKLKAEFGDKAGYVSIGQAGEWKLAAASVAFTDRELRPTRHAGRGGLGAVMGSKGLKAIIIDPTGGEPAPRADQTFCPGLAGTPGHQPGADQFRDRYPDQYHQRGRGPADAKFQLRPVRKSGQGRRGEPE